MIALAKPTTAAEVIANIKSVRARLGLTPKPGKRIALSSRQPVAEEPPASQGPTPDEVFQEKVTRLKAGLSENQAFTRYQIDKIRMAVALHYGIDHNTLEQRIKKQKVIRARQIAIYFMRKRLPWLSLPQIGRRLGQFDHTTILHAVRRIEELVGKDPAVASDIEQINQLLNEGDGVESAQNRDLRDRLGEAMLTAQNKSHVPWERMTEEAREVFRTQGDKLRKAGGHLGLMIGG